MTTTPIIYDRGVYISKQFRWLLARHSVRATVCNISNVECSSEPRNCFEICFSRIAAFIMIWQSRQSANIYFISTEFQLQRKIKFTSMKEEIICGFCPPTTQFATATRTVFLKPNQITTRATSRADFGRDYTTVNWIFWTSQLIEVTSCPRHSS